MLPSDYSICQLCSAANHSKVPCSDRRCSPSSPAARSHPLGESGHHARRKNFFRCLCRNPDPSRKDNRLLVTLLDGHKAAEDNLAANSQLLHADIHTPCTDRPTSLHFYTLTQECLDECKFSCHSTLDSNLCQCRE